MENMNHTVKISYILKKFEIAIDTLKREGKDQKIYTHLLKRQTHDSRLRNIPCMHTPQKDR